MSSGNDLSFIRPTLRLDTEYDIRWMAWRGWWSFRDPEGVVWVLETPHYDPDIDPWVAFADGLKYFRLAVLSYDEKKGP